MWDARASIPLAQLLTLEEWEHVVDEVPRLSTHASVSLALQVAGLPRLVHG
jgi:hypothetical protein